MRYLVERNYVQVLGIIWMPATTAATEYPLSSTDVENIREYGEGELTREAIADWLTTHSGDFQNVTDFSASIGDQEWPWEQEDSEFQYNDCMFPAED